MGNLKITITNRTDKGQKRTNNEDSVLVDPELALFAVADGMGGHQAGEVASRMAVELLHENMKKMIQANIRPEKFNDKISLRANQLAFCVELTNQAIFEASKRYPQDRGMGTTLSVCIAHEGQLAFAHVGDSRIYIMRNNSLEQISQDHSLVMDQVRKGLITKEEAENSKLSNVLMRAIGTESTVQVDAEEHPLFPNDLILLCSDGLFKMLNEEEILAIVQASPDPQTICDTLIEAANAAGGVDNITVALAKTEATGLLSNLKSKISGFKSALGGKENHA